MVCPMRIDTYFNYEPMPGQEKTTVLVSQTEAFGACHEWECPFYDENYDRTGKPSPYCKYYGQVGEEEYDE